MFIQHIHYICVYVRARFVCDVSREPFRSGGVHPTHETA